VLRYLAETQATEEDPDAVSPQTLSSVIGSIVVGKIRSRSLSCFNKAAGTNHQLDPAIASRREKRASFSSPGSRYVRVKLAEGQLLRHRRKYAAGELARTRAFISERAQRKFNFRAPNRNLFAQLAEGLDDET
jgi:hypothetical protein